MLRPKSLRLTAFTTLETTGMPAIEPTRSVEDSTLSRSRVPPLRKRTALARSIRCGKSMFQGCGGTYGHLVM